MQRGSKLTLEEKFFKMTMSGMDCTYGAEGMLTLSTFEHMGQDLYLIK